MTAATVSRLTDHVANPPRLKTLPMVASFLALKGCMVTIDANGRAAPVTAPGATGLNVTGVPMHADADNSAGANDDLDIELDVGIFAFFIEGATPVADDLVYAVDNQTVSVVEDDGGGFDRGKAGYVTKVVGTLCYVNINPASTGAHL